MKLNLRGEGCHPCFIGERFTMGGERVLKGGAGTRQWGPSLEVQWLRRQASTARGAGSSPVWELRSHMLISKDKIIKQNAKKTSLKKERV